VLKAIIWLAAGYPWSVRPEGCPGPPVDVLGAKAFHLRAEVERHLLAVSARQIDRLQLGYSGDHLLDFSNGSQGPPPSPRFIIQPRQALQRKAMRPFGDARQAHSQLPGDGLLIVTLGTEQDDPRTQILALGRGARANSALQLWLRRKHQYMRSVRLGSAGTTSFCINAVGCTNWWGESATCPTAAHAAG
jgi:hypothetical protein